MWFRVDDKLWGSPKWLGLRPGPRALWVTAGAYSMDQLTDGVVPSHVIPILGGRPSDATALVNVGLWELHPSGFAFHDWSDYQPSRESILGKRDAETQRKADWRAKRAAQRAVSDDGHEDVPDVSQRDKGVRHARVPNMSRSSRPDPTRPDPTSPKGEVSTAPDGAAPDGSQGLVGEWIEHCADRPPSRVIGQVSKEIKAMLTEGIPYAHVRDGLAAWHTKGLHPSTLASVVHETRTATATPKRSTGTNRAMDTLAIADRYAAQEGDTRVAITDRATAG